MPPYPPLKTMQIVCDVIYGDDTLARTPNTDAAADFLNALNGLHPSLKFTMELPADNIIPFIVIELIKTFSKPCRQTLQDRLIEDHPIAPIPCHLRQKPLMRDVPSYALYSPDFIIQLAS